MLSTIGEDSATVGTDMSNPMALGTKSRWLMKIGRRFSFPNDETATLRGKLNSLNPGEWGWPHGNHYGLMPNG